MKVGMKRVFEAKKVYDRKIKVKCNTCKKVYTKWATKFLYHKLDGSQCNCKPNFTIIEELLMKQYYRQDISIRKYTINFHNGVSTHNDGSPFYDMRIFKNKKKMNEFIKELQNKKYKERNSIQEGGQK